MIVTATQIKIKSILAIFRFFPRVRKIKKQLGTADGLIFHKFQGSRTLTGWKDIDAMKLFRNSGDHLDAMKNIKKIGKAKSITWESEIEPNWAEAKQKLSDVQF